MPKHHEPKGTAQATSEGIVWREIGNGSKTNTRKRSDKGVGRYPVVCMERTRRDGVSVCVCVCRLHNDETSEGE